MREEQDTETAVFLVDDHAVVRTGLATYLGTEPGMRVVGQAANGRRALDELAVLANSGLRAPKSAAAALTPRERDVIVLIAEGGTNRQIAKHLRVTERTARTHVARVVTTAVQERRLSRGADLVLRPEPA